MAKHNTIKDRHKSERKYLYTITRIYVLIILAVFPLYMGPEKYDNIIFRKAQFFWIASISFIIIFSIFYTVYYWGLKYNERPERFYKTMSVADWAVLAFLFFITISFILSKYKDVAFLGTANRNDGWLSYLLMLAVYFPISRWYKLCNTDINIFAISNILVCFIGSLQFYGYDIFNLFPYYRKVYCDALGNPLESGFSITFRSTIGNTNFVSAYIVILILAFSALYMKTKEPIRYFYLFTAFSSFLMKTVGASDSSSVALVGAFFLLIPYWIVKRDSCGRFLILLAGFGIIYSTHHWIMINKIMPTWTDETPMKALIFRSVYNTLPLKPVFAISIICLLIGVIFTNLKFKAWPSEKVAKISGIILILAIIVIGLAVIEITGSKVSERSLIYQAREVLHGRVNEYTASNRGYVWNAALEVFPQNPLFGTGPDTFMEALGETRMYFNGERFDKAHNDLLQILVCNGIFALISYLTALIALLIKSYKHAFNDKYTLMACAAALAYLVQSLTGIDTIVVTPIFWLLLAIIRGRINETVIPQIN